MRFKKLSEYDEELKWVGDNGEPTEALQQSGWSFQDDEYNKIVQ